MKYKINGRRKKALELCKQHLVKAKESNDIKRIKKLTKEVEVLEERIK